MSEDTKRLFGVFLALCLACAAALAILVFGMVMKAEAHEWYSGKRDPVTTIGCCGGSDCAPVPLDVDWVRPVAEGYRVTLTVEQAHNFNAHVTMPIDEIIPWARVQIVDPKKYEGPQAIYHICINGNQIRCLFATPGA